MPEDEALVLPVDNIVVETLAIVFAQALVARLGPALKPGVVAGLEVSISESAGQGGTYYLAL
jgi:hypothetical protein